MLQVSGVLFLSGASTRNLSLAVADLSCLRQVRERYLVLSNAFKPAYRALHVLSGFFVLLVLCLKLSYRFYPFR